MVGIWMIAARGGKLALFLATSINMVNAALTKNAMREIIVRGLLIDG